ncbi:hypothetical protein MASR2M8_03690 [Opitutaceae bacterium]
MSAEMFYAFRPDAFSPARTHRIERAGLLVTDESGRSELIRWDEITAVDLIYAPNRFATNRHVCRLFRRTGQWLEIASCSYERLATFRDQAASFNDFVRALHRSLAAGDRPVAFGRAEAVWKPPLCWATAGILLVMMAGLVGGMALGGVARWLTAVKILIIIALTPALLRWVKRSPGGIYDPRAIPSRRLPEAKSDLLEEGMR